MLHLYVLLAAGGRRFLPLSRILRRLNELVRLVNMSHLHTDRRGGGLKNDG